MKAAPAQECLPLSSEREMCHSLEVSQKPGSGTVSQLCLRPENSTTLHLFLELSLFISLLGPQALKKSPGVMTP